MLSFVLSRQSRLRNTKGQRKRENTVLKILLSSAASGVRIKEQTWSVLAEIWTACWGLTVLYSERLDRCFELLVESYGQLIAAGRLSIIWWFLSHSSYYDVVSYVWTCWWVVNLCKTDLGFFIPQFYHNKRRTKGGLLTRPVVFTLHIEEVFHV